MLARASEAAIARLRPWMIAVLVALVALLPRIAVFSQIQRSPLQHQLVADEEAYDLRARQILDGDYWLGRRPFYQDPLYPYALAAVYRWVPGDGIRSVRLLQIVLGALGAGLVALSAARLGGLLAAAIAGLSYALLPTLWFYDLQIEKTGPTVALTATLLWGWLRADAGPRRSWIWLAVGANLGLLCLLRGNYLLLAPAAVLGAGLRGRGYRSSLLVAIGTMMLILPATIRNLAVSGELVLVTSQGGQNFFIGNWSGNETGSYLPPPFLRAHPFHEEDDLRRHAEFESGKELSAAETSRHYWRLALAEVRRDPMKFARASLRRLMWSVHPVDVPDNHDQRFLAERIPALHFPIPVGFCLLAIGGSGLLFGSLKRVDSRAIGLFVLFYGGSLLPFFVFGRYRAPIFPALAIGAGLFTADLIHATAVRRWRLLMPRLVLVTAVGVGLRLLPEVPGQDAQNWNTWGTALERSGRLDDAKEAYSAAARVGSNPLAHYNLGRLFARERRWDQASLQYREAIALNPRMAEAHANLGAMLLDQNRPADAQFELQLAIELDSRLTLARFNLGLCAERTGRPAEAIRRYREVAAREGATALGTIAVRRALAIEQGSARLSP